MKTQVRVFFHGHRIPGGADAVLGLARCGPDVAVVTDRPALGAVDVWVTLDDNDERLPILLQLLEQHGEGDWVEREDRFTDAEFDAAHLIVIWARSILDGVFAGPRVGTQYDMSEACKLCGSGARQTSAMVVEGDDLHKLEGQRAAPTCYNDILVDEGIASALVQSGATGLSFRGVFAAFEKKGHLQLPWRQLCATHTVPRMSPRSTGIEPYKSCPCGRSSFTTSLEIPPRLTYRASDVADMRDVNVTWEWFGEVKFNGDVYDSILAYPLFLVTPKVWRIFRDAGVTGFDWMPIRVIDE